MTGPIQTIYRPDKTVKMGPAEMAVIRLSADGYSMKQISAMRNVSVRTVENQILKATQKCGARNKTQMCVWYALGLIDDSGTINT